MKKLREAISHMEFATELYNQQVAAGRLFLHEHPDGATSWEEESIKGIRSIAEVLYVKADQCQFGLKVKEKGQEHLLQKGMGFMTNSPELAKELAKTCRGGHHHR